MQKFTKNTSNLFHFMLLFEINRFTIVNESENIIKARIGWGDDGIPGYDENEEIQDIEWDVQYFQDMGNVLLVIDFIRDSGLINSDKINVDIDDLRDRVVETYNWDKEKFDNAIASLLAFKVDMIDNGEKTDYFFIHF